MRIRTTILIALLLPFNFPTSSQAQLFGDKNSKAKEHHTQVSLVADVKTIQPGIPFTVGVLMQMDEGWHTYWKYAGEAGLPTEIKWKLPEEFTAGDIQWPLPHKYNESGDVLTYGYETENMLLVQITSPQSLQSVSSITLKAEVSWLECEKLCVPGDANVELKMSVASAAPEKNSIELFEKYRKQIPQPFVSNSEFSLNAEAKNGKVGLQLDNTGAKRFAVKADIVPDFYPEPMDGLTIGRTYVAANAEKVSMQIPLSALEKVAGPLTLRGVLVYQVEGEERKAVTVEIPLSKEFCENIPIGKPTDASSQQTVSLLDQKFNMIETAQAQQPLYVYILFAIIGGLLLNIMPCVLPVISLKIFGLMKMAGDNPHAVKKSGWFFSLGILASFLALALLVVILKSAGESVGWGFQFQEPLFVIAMTTVVFAFGLSLFGVYEINLPSFAVAGASTVASKAEGKKGFLAPFSEGIFATILATPCTAPILGTALGFAFAQPASVTFLIFAATAIGMALPYLILTAKPTWMKFLPTPGQWMVTAKQFMGFLMMATAVWLLYILGKQLGMESVIWTTAFLLFVGIACWMIGSFATLTATRVKSIGTWVAALVVVVIGYQLFIGDIVKARDVLSNTAPANTNSAASTETNGITWQPFTIEKLESHLKNNKAVFIDFTAEWCLTCKVNEKTVLADQDIISKLQEKNIVAMKADWTNRNETIARLLQKFGRSGVPLYVLFPAGKPTEPIVLPEVITTGIVLEALEKAN